jgi:AcrR family transcriptional regulator
MPRPAPTIERRRQADRTAATKAALADAAIEVLIERGWAAVTAIEVCTRAGVTRGAFHHHYDSLPELIADALRRLYAEMHSASVAPPTDLVGVLDRTWVHVGSPRFKAVIEAWLAMANDPTLRAEIGPVVAEFATLVTPDDTSTLAADSSRRDFYLAARESMLGLALGRATNGGEPLGHEASVLARFRAEAAAIDAAAPTRKRTRSTKTKERSR